MSTQRDELAKVIFDSHRGNTQIDLQDDRRLKGSQLAWAGYAADAIVLAGYRQVFDGDCGLSGVKDPTDREASEAWMRWANLAMNDEVGAIGAMKQMLTEFGYRKPRTITTVEDLAALPVGSVVLYHGRAFQHYPAHSAPFDEYQQWKCGDGGFVRSTKDGSSILPATVLHEGTHS